MSRLAQTNNPISEIGTSFNDVGDAFKAFKALNLSPGNVKTNKNKPKIQKNQKVLEVQQALRRLGYPLKQYGADGYLGDETIDAIMKWCADNNVNYKSEDFDVSSVWDKIIEAGTKTIKTPYDNSKKEKEYMPDAGQIQKAMKWLNDLKISVNKYLPNIVKEPTLQNEYKELYPNLGILSSPVTSNPENILANYEVLIKVKEFLDKSKNLIKTDYAKNTANWLFKYLNEFLPHVLELIEKDYQGVFK